MYHYYADWVDEVYRELLILDESPCLLGGDEMDSASRAWQFGESPKDFAYWVRKYRDDIYR